MTLNEAIWHVITTQRKKDMTEGVFDRVKKAGYEVRYRGGGEWWEVRHPITRKAVYIRVSTGYYGRSYLEIGNRSIKIENWDGCKVDFVGYLMKPINLDYWANLNYRYEPTKDKYERLRSLKWNLGYHTREIEKVRRELASKQKELEYEIERKAEYEHRLNDIKKEYKLIK